MSARLSAIADRPAVRCAAAAVLLAGLEWGLAAGIGAVAPLSALALILVPGLALYFALPGDREADATRWALVPVVGTAACSLIVIGMSAAGIPLTGPNIRAALLALALLGLVAAALVPGGPALRLRSGTAGAALAVGGVIGLGLALQLLVVGGLPVPGNDWAHYLLYAQQAADHGTLLLRNPFWMGGVPFREDPGAPSLYTAYLVLSGQPAASLAHGILLFAALGIASVFAFAGTLWGRSAGVIAAAVYAVVPMNLTILGWHGLANVYALVFLPCALLAAGMGLRGRGTPRWSALLALCVVAIAAGHRLTFIVGMAALAAAMLPALVRRFGQTARFLGLSGLVAALLAPGLVRDLIVRNDGAGGLQDYHKYLASKVDLELVLRDLTVPLMLALVAAVTAILVFPQLRRDRAQWVLAGLGAATMALAYAWVAHLPSVYFRAAYFLPLLAAAAIGAAARALPPNVRWPGAALLVAIVGLQAHGAAGNVRGFYTWTDPASLRGLGYVESRLAPREAVVTDRCWSFLASWLVQRPTLAALDGTDILPSAEVRPAAVARTILYGQRDQAERQIRRTGARYALVNPQCADERGRALRPPATGTPIYESTRLVVLALGSRSDAGERSGS